MDPTTLELLEETKHNFLFRILVSWDLLDLEYSHNCKADYLEVPHNSNIFKEDNNKNNYVD